MAAMSIRQPPSSAPVSGGDEVGAAPAAGRGSMRGRREIGPPIITRPSNVVSKKADGVARIKLSSNYFKLLTQTDWALYQYRVDFNPDEIPTGQKKGLLKVHKETLGAPYLFDGTVLYMPKRLHADPLELYSERSNDSKKIGITIKLVHELVQGDFLYIHVFNVLMRRCLGYLGLQLVNRDYFDPANRKELRSINMEIWPGYVTTLRQHEEQILLCSEVIHKVLRLDSVHNLIAECQTRDNRRWMELFTSAIVGSVVLTDYNNKTYRIDDVDFSNTPESTFELKRGEKISYMDYYQNKYRLAINDRRQPLLVSKPKPRDVRAGMTTNIVLIPELCRLTGLTDEMRSNFQLMKTLNSETCVAPKVRIQSLLNFNKRLTSNPQVKEELNVWNIRLADRLIEFEGHRFNPENIVLGNQQKVNYKPNIPDWTSALRDHSMLSIAPFSKWVVIVPTRNRQDATAFVGTLVKAASSLRFAIPSPEWEVIPDDRAGTYVAALDKVINRVNPQLIMCVVSNNRIDRYSAIKKKCCIDRAVPTQVILAKNLSSKGVMSIATKVAIQINCKLGGAPWCLDIPLKGLMVVGYDVCHDTSSKGRSFGAMVASLDGAFSRYYSSVTAHSSGEELSNDLSLSLVKAVVKYKTYNGFLPKFIVIYRDGVGEGMIPYVYNTEVNLILNKISEVYGGTDLPKMAVIVVTKKISTRIFENGENPLPGTVVDTCITCPDKYDFFLVSQSVRQGTVSPTNYNVIYDTTNLLPERMQKLAYKMTHLYYNWSGTVRVPAPCQYAHKLAFLTGQALHRSPNPGLEDLLYFL